MSDQPTGEWTAESVMKMFGWRYKKRAEVVADAHNAALAAEREKHAEQIGTLVNQRSGRDLEIKQLRDQLSAEREKVESAERNCDLLPSEKHRKSMEIQQLRSQVRR